MQENNGKLIRLFLHSNVREIKFATNFATYAEQDSGNLP